MMKLLRLIVLMLVLGSLCLGYRVVAPERPDYSAAHLDLAQKAAGETVTWLNDLSLAAEKTFFGNLGHDEFGFVSRRLRLAIRQLDKVPLGERGFRERALSVAGWTLTTFGDSSSLLAAARSSGCRYAIGGKVIRFSQLDQRVELEVEVAVWDVAGEKLIGQKRIKLGPDGANTAGSPDCSGQSAKSGDRSLRGI